MSKEVSLTRGMVTVVDDEDYEWSIQWKWQAHSRNNTFYAARNEKRKTISLHREIFYKAHGHYPKEVDHANQNKLDNRRSNLRAATSSQNRANVNPRTDGTSKYKGVHWHKHRQRWVAAIRKDKRSIHIGLFDFEKEAAKAYDKAALSAHGRFAVLNFPEDVDKLFSIDNFVKNKPRKASAYPGVSKRGDKWRVRLQRDGKRVQVGNFDNEREAYNAYLKAKESEKV